VECLRSKSSVWSRSLKADLEKLSNEVHSNMVEIREESRAGLERKLDVAPFEEKFRLGWGGAQVVRACVVRL
jgi:hypothetical protein